jgi:hypothetical protein
MARPRKPRRDPEKPARTFDQITAIIAMAKQFFLMLGGADTDLQIDALAYTARAFSSQMNWIEHDGRDQNPWGPNVSTYEARMTAGRSAALQRLRDQKMAQCMAWAEEAAEAAAGTATEGTVGEGTVPEVRDCPRSSDQAEPASQAPTAATRDEYLAATAPKAARVAKDGDGAGNAVHCQGTRSLRELELPGQSPLRKGKPLPEPHVFCDIAMPREEDDFRAKLAQMLQDTGHAGG